jgi:hypothetical protein
LESNSLVICYKFFSFGEDQNQNILIRHETDLQINLIVLHVSHTKKNNAYSDHFATEQNKESLATDAKRVNTYPSPYIKLTLLLKKDVTLMMLR